jgi:hypothetical protein
MKMSDMKVKSWYKVQLIAKSKTFKVTKQEFKTKSEGIEKGISKGYDILNLKALNRLICEGWTEYTAKEENVLNQAVEIVSVVNTIEQSNPDIEAQIEAYAKAKIERDIQAYAKKKAKQSISFVKNTHVKDDKSEMVKQFLATPPVQPKVESFNYDKQLEKFYKKTAPRNQRDKQRQIADYCGEVSL